jgi:ketosteroid isomerase-like protein
MKKVILNSVSVVLFVLFTASMAFAQTSAEYKTKIEVMNKEMAKNMLAGNSEKNLAMYTEDAISMPSYEPMHDGLPAIKKASEDMAKSGIKFTAFQPTIHKVIVNGDMICEIGTYKITMTMPGMEKPMDDHGKYLTMWLKQKDGSLKVKLDTWNSDVNPASMSGTADSK